VYPVRHAAGTIGIEGDHEDDEIVFQKRLLKNSKAEKKRIFSRIIPPVEQNKGQRYVASVP
ncbi:MAG: hypothetical protein AAGH67_09595, partial [Cyanobacteria bacterium P01_H01_bin.162]